MQIATRRPHDHKYQDSEIEESWAGGPWRKKGTGHGSQGRYVCQACRRVVQGVYHVPSRQNRPDSWLCGGCRNAE